MAVIEDYRRWRALGAGGLPDSYLFLYAPRDATDHEHLVRIIDRVVAAAR